MADHYAAVRRPRYLRAGDKVLHPHRQCFAPHQPGVARPQQQHQHHDDIDDARLGGRYDYQGQQDDGNGQRYVHQAHYQGVHPAAPIAGGDAQRNAKYAGDQDGDGGNRNRHAGSVHNPGQNIPPDTVGAQQMVQIAAFHPERRLQARRQAARFRIVRRDEVGKERRNDQHNQQQRDGEQRVAARFVPETA